MNEGIDKLDTLIKEAIEYLRGEILDVVDPVMQKQVDQRIYLTAVTLRNKIKATHILIPIDRLEEYEAVVRKTLDLSTNKESENERSAILP